MTSLAPAAPVPSMRPPRPAAGGNSLRRRLAEPKERVWTLSIIAVVVYLFVVHSFKLNIGSAAIVIGLAGLFMSGQKLRGSTPMMWYALYLGWALLTLPMAMRAPMAWTAWTDSLKILLIMFLALNAIQTKKQHRLITLAWLGMFAFYPVRGTLFNFLTGQSSFGRYGWNFTFANFNDLAALTLIPLALTLDRLRTPDKKWIKLCAFAGLIILPFIVIITQSRGGMLGAAAFLLFLLARSRYKLRLSMAVVIMGIGAYFFAPKSVWDRVSGMQNLTSVETIGDADSSAEQRWLIWQVAAEVIINNPVFGVGIGNYGVAHQKFARSNVEWNFARGKRDTHNTYLHITAENGIVGILLFMMIFVSSYRSLVQTARSVKGSLIPEEKELADRCQAYQAAYVGLAVCAIFGSLEMMVFPFLLVSLASATTLLYSKAEPVRQKRFNMSGRMRGAMAPKVAQSPVGVQPRPMPR